MTSDEVADIIFDEINSGFDITSVYGFDLRHCLVTPVLEDYINSNDHSQVFRLWTVFNESNDDKGYLIFYDEEDESFGLGSRSQNGELLYIANYGSFIETLRGM
jgi:hypothetical protein